MPTRLEDVPAHLVVDFDVHDPALAGVVHERLAELQATKPVSYCPAHGGYWLVTSYEGVHEVVRNWEVFSSAENSVPSNLAMGKSLPLEIDPPEHTTYRQLLNPLFSPARMKALEAEIRATATELLDGFASRGECEFISEFAHPLPTRTFLALMGWPQGDAPLFHAWSEDILMGRPGASDEEDLEVRMKASGEVFGYFTDAIAHRRAEPTDDVTSTLLEARLGGERLLTDDELLRMLWLLMLGGLHTVRGVLGFGMTHLAGNPRERQRIIDDPSLIPSAVEEILRLDAPVVPGRVVTKDVTFGGVDMREGDRVLAFLSAASRDPNEFEDPHAVHVDRATNRHLAFSGGPHRCVGSSLGRVELAVALEEIHRRIPDYELVPERPPALHHSQVRGLHHLSLRFTPETSAAS
jgi:cytochrome P450